MKKATRRRLRRGFPVIPLAKAQGRETSAPTARFLGYFSRKGAKNAKLAKGRKGFVLPLRALSPLARAWSA